MSAGFTDDAFSFYEGLQADNSKSYWTSHKDVYERHVREPLIELCAVLEDEFGAVKLFRPYRDVRFSKDKSPYKTHQGGHTSEGFYLQVDADGLMVAGGMYAPTPDQLRRYREAAARHRRGRAPGHRGRPPRRRHGDRGRPAQDPAPRHAPGPSAARPAPAPLPLRPRGLARRPLDGRPRGGGHPGANVLEAPAPSSTGAASTSGRPTSPGDHAAPPMVLALLPRSCILIEARATRPETAREPVPHWGMV